MESGSRTKLYQDQGYVEADRRVREESAVLYDLKHVTPVDRDAVEKQRAASQGCHNDSLRGGVGLSPQRRL